MPSVTLPPFQMTDQEIARALEYPIETPIRLEAKVMPDVKRPNEVRRVVAAGAKIWAGDGDRSVSKLIQHLLYLYFTGQLQVGTNTYASRFNNQAALMVDTPEDDDSDIELDFDFKDG